MNLKRKFVAISLSMVMLFAAVPMIISESDMNVVQASYSVEAASKVYYAEHSKKYHKTKHCRTLKRSKHIYKCSKKKAKKMGLKKCKVCW
jgi:hypothetical protein